MPEPALLSPDPGGEAFDCPTCRVHREGEPNCTICHACVTCCGCETCLGCARPITANTTSCGTCGLCRRCCVCVSCSSCNRLLPQAQFTCQNCHTCGNCCNCWSCACGKVYDGGMPRCPDCSRCLNCCACAGNNRGFRFQPPRPRFHAVTRFSERVRNTSKRFLSTEIEVSKVDGGNRNTARAVAKWGGAIVNDGSLSYGFEINTAPAAGDHFVRQIEEICAGLEKDGGEAGADAGAHVHVDARDFTFPDMQRLVTLYARVETVLYGLVSPRRFSNHYCQPCGEKYIKHVLKGRMPPKAVKTQILTNLYGADPGRNLEQIRRGKYHEVRYNALNLHSWIYRGTVECRMMHGSTNPENLSKWGMMWAYLLDAAMARSMTELQAVPKTLDGLLSVMPKDSVKAWILNRWAMLHRKER